MAKKYYWLKLKKDFFQDKKMKKLRKVAGGEIYTLIYLKLQLLSLENEGVLFHDGIEEDFAEELSLDIDEEANHIEATLFLLEKWGLIEKIESNKFVLPQAVESIGNESGVAERVRKHRLKKKEELKALQCNNVETKGNTEIEIEIEKEIELDIEKDKTIVQSKELNIPFDTFWNMYDKKTGKKKSEKKWSSLTNQDREDIMEFIPRYKKVQPDKVYRKDPMTFFNNESWKDELIDKKFNNSKHAREYVPTEYEEY